MRSARILAFLIPVSLASTLLLSGCGKKSNEQTASAGSTPTSSSQPANVPPPPPPDQTAPPSTPAPPPTVVIPVATHLRVRLDEDLGSKISQPGQSFGATVADDVMVGGQTVIPRGAHAEGTVI
ncbi:MAG: hypothetical protein WBH45_04095, partial [Acidobacteriaceae bacterium]